MLEPPRYCADLFSTLDPDVLMNTMVRLAVDQSGRSSVVVQCKMPALQPLVDASAFPGLASDFRTNINIVPPLFSGFPESQTVSQSESETDEQRVCHPDPVIRKLVLLFFHT